MDGAQIGADLFGTRTRTEGTAADSPRLCASGPSVTILLSTYNGEKYLAHQLGSFLQQTHTNWRLVWRDDGSSDASCAVVEAFACEAGSGFCVKSPSSGPHLGAAASFLHLLEENRDASHLAFADQDDCWLPEKLQRGLRLFEESGSRPLLYCARQILTDEDFSHPVPSMKFRGVPGFPASLSQNIATGGTILMNNAAARLISSIPLPEGSNHDWWSYLVVSACGGSVVYDEIPSMLYRQHAGNVVGSQMHPVSRAIAALERGGGFYMTMMRRHVERLWEHRALMPDQTVADLESIRLGLAGSYVERFVALGRKGFRRATALETFVFRLWFLLL